MRAVACLVVLAACAGQPAYTPDAPAIADVGISTALGHTVLMAEGCTAVELGGGTVVTAKHCVDDIELGDVTSVGVLKFRSETWDFGLLFDEVNVEHVGPALRNCRFGEHLYTVGYPSQLATDTQELTVTDGLCAGPLDKEGNQRITAPIYYGNSGGGVWASDGSLLGISVNGYLDLPAMNYMVPAEEIAAALF